MARRELGPAALLVGQAVARLLPKGDVIVGCSGGADSLALALGAAWAARGGETRVRCVVVDHRLQAGSARIADEAVGRLTDQGLAAQSVAVDVDESAGGLEAAARAVRLGVLASAGLPVLLGHTLDDQAETVLLALLRGSGTRAMAGMAEVRGPFLRPLLGLRRATTEQACREWGVEWWEDPHNDHGRFARVRVRRHLADLRAQLGRDVAPALARSAQLARFDADYLDDAAEQLAAGWVASDRLRVDDVDQLPDALRLRVLRDWLRDAGASNLELVHVLAVDELLTNWRGQGMIALPGGGVVRRQGELRWQGLG